ncbi:ankyrin repeat and SOCS box protein 13a.1 isoform X3 [Nelusetta ayraudi]|uniref:ankyrin repeat and SOCS box protein 13a.1 isoform X3 n=1 Tax=Nelusetta ayraudi TaxID=303726 RepID=UPI003F719DDB
MEVTAARRSFLCDIGFWADRTALHEAASHGRTLQLKELIESGSSVNTVTVDNITPLHEACIQARPNCARLLLEAGAQVDVRTIHGSTPLCNACAGGSLECAKLLLCYGANVNPSLTALTASPLHEACIRGAKVNSVKFHETALHHAARGDMLDMIELLVMFGADVYASDNLGRKPVDYATSVSPAHTCLTFYENHPLSLQQLCRISVRMVLGTKASKVIGQLDIPPRICSYLNYCD